MAILRPLRIGAIYQTPTIYYHMQCAYNTSLQTVWHGYTSFMIAAGIPALRVTKGVMIGYCLMDCLFHSTNISPKICLTIRRSGMRFGGIWFGSNWVIGRHTVQSAAVALSRQVISYGVGAGPGRLVIRPGKLRPGWCSRLGWGCPIHICCLKAMSAMVRAMVSAATRQAAHGIAHKRVS